MLAFRRGAISASALSCILGLFIVPSVLAETAPDAGKTQRQLEQTVRPLTPKAKRPRDSAPLPLAPKPGEVAITVRQFEVTGAQGLSVAQLNEALAPFLNRPLGFSGLQLAADAALLAYESATGIENGLAKQVGSSQALNMSLLTKNLKRAKDFLAERVARRNGTELGAEVVAEAESGGAVQAGGGNVPRPAAISGEIASREDVLKMIDKICT